MRGDDACILSHLTSLQSEHFLYEIPQTNTNIAHIQFLCNCFSTLYFLSHSQFNLSTFQIENASSILRQDFRKSLQA